MSASKPVAVPAAKRPRMAGMSQQKQTQVVNESMVVESIPLTSSQSSLAPVQDSESKTKSVQAPNHPKGHKVYQLSKVWETMDQQSFLRLTDTLMLGDVWMMPLGASPMNATCAHVTCKQIVSAPHIKSRIVTTKMATDDLIKILYLCECMQWSMQGVECLSFDDWMKDKSAACVKVKGVEEGTNRALLCNYIITEDREFTFYPPFLHGVGIFFRKTCYHSYKTDTPGGKMINPAMIKCTATRSKFEYMLEGRIIPLPVNWFDEEPTPTQPMDGPLDNL